MEISKDQAIRLALHSQLHRQRGLRGKEGVRELVRQLGYVQIDTISVVERAHHHTIWSRIPDYDKAWLDELLAQDRAVFEHWGHAASYLPMEDYRYSLPRMRKFPDTSSWERRFFEKYKHLTRDILRRIEAEGPLGARDFPDTRATKTDYGWGSGKPAKIALELLLWKGELMVDRRENFQRIYELTERVLPDWVDRSLPHEAELRRHQILRSLQALGVGTRADIRGHFSLAASAAFDRQLEELVGAGEIARIEVSGAEDEYYALPEELAKLDEIPGPKDRAYLLSPFDNAVIQRPRLKRLFGFDYTLECYVTPKKRIYGYWCLPILYQNRFIGRLDCKANRITGVMDVNSLHWESGRPPALPARKAVQKTFDFFSEFCGCESVPLF